MRDNIVKDEQNRPIPHKKGFCPSCGEIRLFWIGRTHPVCSTCYGESFVTLTDHVKQVLQMDDTCV